MTLVFSKVIEVSKTICKPYVQHNELEHNLSIAGPDIVTLHEGVCKLI